MKRRICTTEFHDKIGSHGVRFCILCNYPTRRAYAAKVHREKSGPSKIVGKYLLSELLRSVKLPTDAPEKQSV